MCTNQGRVVLIPPPYSFVPTLASHPLCPSMVIKPSENRRGWEWLEVDEIRQSDRVWFLTDFRTIADLKMLSSVKISVKSDETVSIGYHHFGFVDTLILQSAEIGSNCIHANVMVLRESAHIGCDHFHISHCNWPKSVQIVFTWIIRCKQIATAGILPLPSSCSLRATLSIQSFPPSSSSSTLRRPHSFQFLSGQVLCSLVCPKLNHKINKDLPNQRE